MVRQQYQTHFVFSLLLHVGLLLILVLSFEWSAEMPVLKNSDRPDEIQAMIIEEPLKPSKMIPKELPSAPLPPKLEVAKPAPTPKQVTQPKPVEKAIAIPDKKLQEEKIQKELLADLKKQNDEKKKQKQKALQTAFEKELAAIKAEKLEKRLLQEKQQLLNARASQMQGVVDRYKALILQSIGRHWLIPPNANKKLFAELLIRVGPGGMVLDVQLMKSSGDDGLDHSARTAVFKASPLPVPTESDAFEAFRQFVLKVKPENIVPS